MSVEPTEESIAAVLSDLAASRGAVCALCRRPVCGHEALFSRLLGFRGASRCLPCLAHEHARSVSELRSGLYRHVLDRDCYLVGWRQANLAEGFAAEALPGCVFSGSQRDTAGQVPEPSLPEPPRVAEPSFDVEWNAGQLGCGDLVLELRQRLRDLPPRAVIRVAALDPGAPEDLPAWCRLTGHKLIAYSHPLYWIQRKEP